MKSVALLEIVSELAPSVTLASFLPSVTTTGREVTTLSSFNTLIYALPALTPTTLTGVVLLVKDCFGRRSTLSSLDTTEYWFVTSFLLESTKLKNKVTSSSLTENVLTHLTSLVQSGAFLAIV